MSCWSAEEGGSWEAPKEVAGTSGDKILSAHPSCRAGQKSVPTGPWNRAPSLPSAAASLQHTPNQQAPAAGKRQQGSYHASHAGFAMVLARKEVPAPCHSPSPAHTAPAAPCSPRSPGISGEQPLERWGQPRGQPAPAAGSTGLQKEPGSGLGWAARGCLAQPWCPRLCRAVGTGQQKGDLLHGPWVRAGDSGRYEAPRGHGRH